MLRLRTDAWYSEKKRIGYHETSALLTKLKKQEEYKWLNDVSSVPVQQALQHLQTAFNNFFAKRSKYPSFKKKGNKQLAGYVIVTRFQMGCKVLTLAKMEEPLAIIFSWAIPKAAK